MFVMVNMIVLTTVMKANVLTSAISEALTASTVVFPLFVHVEACTFSVKILAAYQFLNGVMGNHSVQMILTSGIQYPLFVLMTEIMMGSPCIVEVLNI